MAIEIANALQAAGSINSDATVAGGSGFSTVLSHPAAGRYQITLDEDAVDTECAVLATIHNLSNSQVVTSHISNTVKEFQTRQGGVLTDLAFDFIIIRFPHR